VIGVAVSRRPDEGEKEKERDRTCYRMLVDRGMIAPGFVIIEQSHELPRARG
jgi:hypothetical protein